MKAKTKEFIVDVGSFVVTTSTCAMLGWAASGGTALILNSMFKDGVSKGAAKFFETACTLGGIGIAWTAIDPVYTQVRGRLEDVMDIFPTEPEIKEVQNNG